MTGLVFEKLAQPLTAGQLWPIGIGGDFFRVEACEWPVTVALYVGGREVGRMAHVRAGDYVRDMPFEEIRVINGATAQTVTVQIAGGGVGSDRVLGEVSVIDGRAARVYEGVSFSTYIARAAAAGEYAHVQLWNPAGSGRDLVVSGAAVSHAGAAGWVVLAWGTAALTGNAAGGNPRSKKGGAQASVAQGRNQSSAAVLGSAVAFEIFLPSNEGKYIAMNEPFVIEPGVGIMAVSGALGGALSVSFDFYEKTR